MRICERCNVKMLQHKNMYAHPYVGGDGWGYDIEIKIKQMKEKDVLKRLLYGNPGPVTLNTVTVVCPECGKVELYLPTEELEELKNTLTDLIKNEEKLEVQ